MSGCCSVYGTTTNFSMEGSSFKIFEMRSRESMCFPLKEYPLAVNRTLGCICPNRSSTPFMPKSGEQDDQVAPRLVAASIAIIVSGIFGIKPTTLSPT